jgi:two-component system, sensor histidine kinase RegB
MDHGTSLHAHHVNIAWLVRLRWLVWSGHVGLTLWATAGLGIRIPIGWVTAIVLLGLGSNLALWAWLRRTGRTGPGLILAVMLADTVLQTGYFFLTGGPFNPFTTLYLVNLVLGTLVLTRAQQWIQLGASFFAFASLFWLERLAPDSLRLPNHAEMMRLHLGGMLVAFAVAAAFIVSFMHRVHTALKARDAELEVARKLAALTTLAAGAAHELATPLGTIALISKELEHTLGRLPAPQTCLEDVKLVRQQVDRCRDILHGMSGASGEVAGEAMVRFSASSWMSDAVAELPERHRVTLAPSEDEVRGPRAALTQALKNLVKNGLEATPPPGGVSVRSRREGGALVVEVADQGAGVPASVLARIGEPFFTTREPGRGMGLGVFLARTLAEQLGGTLAMESAEGRGTLVRLVIPTGT